MAWTTTIFRNLASNEIRAGGTGTAGSRRAGQGAGLASAAAFSGRWHARRRRQRRRWHEVGVGAAADSNADAGDATGAKRCGERRPSDLWELGPAHKRPRSDRVWEPKAGGAKCGGQADGSRQAEASRSFIFYGVAVNDANQSKLNELCPPHRLAQKLRGLNFGELFSWLSCSLRSVSLVNPGVMRPVLPPITDWALVKA